MQSENLQKIEEIIRTIAGFMNIPCDVSATEEGGSIHAAILAPEDGRLLIGKSGQNLKALEHVVRLVWARQNPEYRAIVVDINNYRAEQTQQLIEIVHTTAQRVQQTRRSEALEPMSSYQRRVIHTELAAYSDLASESVGQEPHRRVVIKPL